MEDIKQNKKELFKNFIWNSIGTGLNSFNSLFFFIIVTRINGIENAGIYSIAYATALILYTVGLYSGRLTQVTDIENKLKDKDYILSRIISSLFMIVIAFVYVFIKGYTIFKLTVCILLTIYKATEAFAEIYYGIMQKNDLLYKSGQSLTFKSLVGLTVFLVVDLFTKNIIVSIIASIVVNVLTIIFYDFKVINKLVDKAEKGTLKNALTIFKNDFFVFANSFAGIYVLNAPKYALDTYCDDKTQAMFGYIIMPATVITLFAQFVFMPFLNDLKKLYAEKNMTKFGQISRKIKYAVLGFGIFAVAAGYLLGPEVLRIIYGVDDLLNYRIQLAIILGAYICYGISYTNLILLTTVRKTFIQFVIYVITMIIAFVGSNMLVKAYGIDGAVRSCVLTLGSQFLMYSITTNVILHKIKRKFEEEKEVIVKED